MYLTLATSLLEARFRPSWITLRGVSSKRDSRYVCRQSLNLDLGSQGREVTSNTQIDQSVNQKGDEAPTLTPPWVKNIILDR